jgi:transcriptional regulator with XRE-family HTH domain
MTNSEPHYTQERPTTLASRITHARLKLGLLQKDVAAQLGVTSAAVGNWERGTSEPRRRYRERLFKILELDTPEIPVGDFGFLVNGDRAPLAEWPDDDVDVHVEIATLERWKRATMALLALPISLPDNLMPRSVTYKKLDEMFAALAALREHGDLPEDE